MRKALYVAALMATTSLWSGLLAPPAHAMPPVLGFLGGIITAVGAPAIGGAVVGLGGAGAIGGFAAGFGFAGSLLGGALLQIGLSLGLSALAAMLRPRPPAPPNPGAKMVNSRQPISYFEFVYGHNVRKGGPVAFWQAKDGKRYYDVILAAHPIGGFIGRFLDENDVSLDEDGFVEQETYIEGHSRVQIAEYLGSPGQVSPPLLNDNFDEWTSAHDMAGLAHAVIVAENVKAEEFSRVYPSGREPIYTGLLDGKLVYDPRDATYKISSNAALIIADWITSADGLGRTVNWSKVALEAGVSDQMVADRNGNLQPQWQLAGSYTSVDDRETVRANLGVACDAFFYEDTDGTVGFYVGRFMQPDVTMTDDDILTIRYSEGQAATDSSNAYVVEYTEADLGFREAAAAPYEIDDGEPYTENSLSVYWIPNHRQAVNIEKRLLTTSKAQYKIQAVFKYGGARLITKRTFQLVHAEAGMNLTMEIDKLTRGEDALTWIVEAHSTTSADHAFNAFVEEPPKPSRIDLEVSDEVPEPENVTAELIQVSGTVAIQVDFDDLARDSLLAQVRFRKTTETNWTTVSVPSGQSQQNIVGVEAGSTYWVQVRSMTSTGQASKWTPRDGDDENDPTLSVVVGSDPVAPTAVVSPSVVGNQLGHVDINFTAPASANVAKVGIYRNQTGTLNQGTDLSQYVNVTPSQVVSGHVDGDATSTQMVTNGIFASAASWTLGNWTIGSGVASIAGLPASNLWQTIAGMASKTLRVVFDVTARTGGGVTPRFFGGTTVTGTLRQTVGTHSENMVASAGSTSLNFTNSSGATLSIDNAIMYEVKPNTLPHGSTYFWLIPENTAGVKGPISGPFNVNVI